MREKIELLLKPVVEALGYELYGCELRSQGKRATVVVYIDSPDGITIDACARVSRQVGASLDVENVLLSSYELEVSSPGIERPLFNLSQVARAQGKMIKVRLHEARGDQRNWVGRVEAVDASCVTLTLEDGGSIQFMWAEVDKAKLISDR